MSDKLTDDVRRSLKEVIDYFAYEDRAVRERQLRQAKRLKYYWDGFQRLWWSETAHDWRVFEEEIVAQSSQDSAFYDKRVNVFRAYLESIIAALSTMTPTVMCYPDDAQNTLDVETAKAGGIIAKQVGRHNNTTTLWAYALFLFCTEGLVACYNYVDKDEKYGTYEVDKYEDEEQEQETKVCSVCGAQVDESFESLEQDEYDPGDDDVISHNGQAFCPNCLAMVDPEIQKNKVIVSRLVGTTKEPKSRQCMEVMGALFLKVPNYAKTQTDCPYLLMERESHYTQIIGEYPGLRDKLVATRGNFSSGGYEPYGRWARTSTQYNGAFPVDVITMRTAWIRPWGFNVLKNIEDVKKLQKLFPDGVKVVVANEEIAEACNECLDDHWTLTKNPLSDFLNFDPAGLLLTSIQEITNDLISLALQQLEHSIGQTMADPTVLDFQAYGNMEVSPGSVIPATPKSGKSLGESFYELKTATFSGEILTFGTTIQSMGQLVSGAIPSIFGGEMEGTKTAAQYSMSRAQALQRLQTPWRMFGIWWKEIFGKVIPAYIKTVVEDERIVEKGADGSFVNTFIRKSQLLGKIGRIELETTDDLPVSWAQQKDVIMQLLQSNNPEVMAFLSTPENLPFVRRAIGLDEFVVPGEDDRNKQYEEIQQLLASEPIMAMGLEGPEEMPTVDIEPTIDNNAIHADICRSWAVSEQGRLAKIENQGGYKNVLLHMQRHVMVQQAMMAMNAPQQPSQPNAQEQKPEQKSQQENNDVSRAVTE